MRQTPRRWFRFSLRTLLVLVTCFAVCLGWLRWQWRIVQARKAAIAEIEAVGGNWWYGNVMMYWDRELPFWRYWMGDDDVPLIWLQEQYARKIGLARTDQIKKLFPEALMKIYPESHAATPTGWPQGVAFKGLYYSEWRAQHPDP